MLGGGWEEGGRRGVLQETCPNLEERITSKRTQADVWRVVEMGQKEIALCH